MGNLLFARKLEMGACVSNRNKKFKTTLKYSYIENPNCDELFQRINNNDILTPPFKIMGDNNENRYAQNNEQINRYSDSLKEDSSKKSEVNSGSQWKFWRRLSSRSQQETKENSDALSRSEIALLENEQHRQNKKTDLQGAVHSPDGSPTLVYRLPDVVEKAPVPPPRSVSLNSTSSVIPPPKPPRLSLFRAPLNNGNQKREKNTNDGDNSPQMKTITNKDGENNNLIELTKPNNRHSSGYQKYIKSDNPSQNDNNVNNSLLDDLNQSFKQNSISPENILQKTVNIERPSYGSPTIPCVNPNESTDLPHTTVKCLNPNESSDLPHTTVKSHMSANTGDYSRVVSRPKTVTPDLSSNRRHGRRRRKSSETWELTRHNHIMSSICELLCERLDPFPVIDQLKRMSVLTNSDVQSFLGQGDRKSVCEGLVSLIGEGSPDLLPLFSQALTNVGTSAEILEIIRVMREIDRIVYEMPVSEKDELLILNEEKNIHYEIGYLASDRTLKSLVELDGVRTGRDKRLSKVSSRASSQSFFEEGSDYLKDGLSSGVIMISVCITGHSLRGPKAKALANMAKNHHCIYEFRLGKTQLTGEDVYVISNALATNSGVHHLDLRLNDIDQMGAAGISDLLTATKSLQCLNLSSTSLDLPSCRTIASAVSWNHTLFDLDLSFLELDDKSGGVLRDMLKNNNCLLRIRLRSNNLTWHGCSCIGESLQRNVTLSELDLSRNNIGNQGVQELAKFLPDSNISELILENCGLTSDCSEALSDIIVRCRKLRQLDVSTNELGDIGVFKLAPSLDRTSVLEVLGLNMCGITNNGFLKLLEGMERNMSILQLKICYNQIGKHFSDPAASPDGLRYRLRIVTSSKPRLKILLWGNDFSES